MDLKKRHFVLEDINDSPNHISRTVNFVESPKGIKVVYNKLQEGQESGEGDCFSFTYDPENPLEGMVSVMGYRSSDCESDKFTDGIRGFYILNIGGDYGDRITTDEPSLQGLEGTHLNDAIKILSGFRPELETQEGIPPLNLKLLEDRLRKIPKSTIETESQINHPIILGNGDVKEYIGNAY